MRQLCLAVGFAAQRAAAWEPTAIVQQLCSYVLCLVALDEILALQKAGFASGACTLAGVLSHPLLHGAVCRICHKKLPTFFFHLLRHAGRWTRVARLTLRSRCL